MTSTPRIDAYLLAHHVADTTAFLDLARQLERELAAANAESQRWQAIAAQMSAEREHNANRAGWLAAELAAARKGAT